MLPDVEKFVEHLESIDKVHREKCDRLKEDKSEKYSTYYGGRTNEYWNELDNICDIRYAAMKLAWDDLERSEDPLIKFIAAECRGYFEESIIVLKSLPATYDELLALGDKEDWCSTFSSFVRKAVREGVIEAPKVSKSRQKMLDWLNDYGMGFSNVRTLMTFADEIVAEESSSANDGD